MTTMRVVWTTLLLSSLLCMLSSCAVEVSATTTSSSQGSINQAKTNTTRPTANNIFTYFERIPIEVRTTGMTDDADDALLDFWKDAWTRAGWNPQILTLEDAQKHANYTNVQSQLAALNLDPFGQASFRKWLAMSTVGGWYAEYDVFPLFNDLPPTELPNGGAMTVHDIVSPSLASGTAEQWLQSLIALLQDSQNHTTRIPQGGDHDDVDVTTFWTDSMGIHSLQQQESEDQSTTTTQLVGNIPKSTKQVALAYNRLDPVASNDPKHCQKRKAKWAIHFGALQMALHIPPQYRLPKYRLSLAKEWLFKWQDLCMNDSNTTTTTTTATEAKI